MKFNFPSIDKYLSPDDMPIKSNEFSKTYINIPQLIFSQKMTAWQVFRMRRHVIGKMIGCMYESIKSSSSIRKNPKSNKVTLTKEELLNLENYIQSLGIDLIGYTKVTPNLIFDGHQILYDNAIVLVMKMKQEAMVTAPSAIGLKEVFRTYYSLGVSVNKIANYLREHGFNAMAGAAIGGDVSYVPLVEKAGLGCIGKHGLLITDKDFGPCLRIATVYTDIDNLPFGTENQHLWIKDFCNKCNKCINGCPAKAIYTEKTKENRTINQDKCAHPFANNYGCSLCIKNCTFFNHRYSDLKEQFLK